MSTAGITYSEAVARIERSRSGQPTIGSNTSLHYAGPNHGPGVAVMLRYHATDVITLHADGTYTLDTGGWNTVTTLRRLNDYSPARVYSDRGQLYVWHSSDPKTPAKIQKCRTCHGTGQTHSLAWTQRYGTLPRDVFEVTESYAWNTYGTDADGPGIWPHLYSTAGEPLTRDGVRLTDQPRGIRIVGQVTRHKAGTHGTLPEPVFHPSVASTCWKCDGTGRADYGSKPNPVIFYDGITVDDMGMVTDPDARRRVESPEAVAARKAAEAEAEAKAAKVRAKAARAAKARFVADYGLTPVRGKLIVFKAVNDILLSSHLTYRGSIRGTQTRYPIGETVTAPDWDGLARCGGGLHFGPNPEIARSYQSFSETATRYLACEVSVRGMVVIGDKVKAESCRVLYEVDHDGNPV
jgi:hypothetical protein